MKRLNKWTAGAVSIAMVISCITPALAAGRTAEKDESVFIALHPDGSIKEQTVSVWLHSDQGLLGYRDKSNLSQIVNLKGEEDPAIKGEQLVWNIRDKDVYYQGKSKGTPAITAKVTYTLDGQEISAEDLAGKEGHVVMTIALENHEKQTKVLDGVSRTLYTPLPTVIGLNLPVDHCANIKAEHGTVQTDSANQLVGFVCMPGLKESFSGFMSGQLADLEKYMLDTVTVEADVKDFTVPSVMIAAANDAESLKENSSVMDFDSLFDDLDELKDATQELLEGASQLADGTKTLQDGVDELQQGAIQLDEGATELVNGVMTIQGLLGQVCENNQALKDGANEIFEAILSTANTTLRAKLGEKAPTLTAGNYSGTLDALLQAMGEEAIYSQVKAEVEKQIKTEENRSKAETLVKMNIAAPLVVKLEAAAAGTELSAEEIQEEAQKLLSTPEGQQKVLGAIENNEQIKAALKANQATIDAAVEQQLDAKVMEALSEGGAAYEQLQQALAQAAEGAKDIAGLQVQLDKVKTFVTGVHSYTGAVGQIYSEGAAQLLGGAKELKSGTDSLVEGAGQLADGASQLTDGADTLLEGFEIYNEEGISRLTDSQDIKNLETISHIADALKEQAQSSNSYTGVEEGTSCTVKYVMKTEEVRPPEAEEASAQVQQEQKPSFWQRIKNLFTR